MSPDKDKELCRKYPNLYKNRHGDPRNTCMCWGFEVGDGWYDIIDRLSAKLEPTGVSAAQVKEKFGGLRFYIDLCPTEKWDYVNEAIDKAEIEAAQTCEICGKPGKINTDGYWSSCRCENCRNERR